MVELKSNFNKCNNTLIEDTIPALWSCKEIECVWTSMSWTHPANSAPPSCFPDLVSKFLQVHDDFRKEIFILIAWGIWNRRNAVRLSIAAQPLSRICSMAGSLLQEFLEVQEPELVPSVPAPMHQWHSPEQRIFEANFNAAVFKSCNLAGIGVIIRDSHGEAIGALTMPIPLSQTVAELEALACYRAVQFAMEIGIQRVIFEGDSAVVIKAILEGQLIFPSMVTLLKISDYKFQTSSLLIFACSTHM